MFARFVARKLKLKKGKIMKEKLAKIKIIFDGKELTKCLDCGHDVLIETDEKGVYACAECGAKFYADDHEGAAFL